MKIEAKKNALREKCKTIGEKAYFILSVLKALHSATKRHIWNCIERYING